MKDIHLGELDRGTHRFPVEITDYPDGMYLIIVQSEKYKETIRLVK